jgi:hypothetical protein
MLGVEYLVSVLSNLFFVCFGEPHGRGFVCCTVHATVATERVGLAGRIPTPTRFNSTSLLLHSANHTVRTVRGDTPHVGLPIASNIYIFILQIVKPFGGIYIPVGEVLFPF